MSTSTRSTTVGRDGISTGSALVRGVLGGLVAGTVFIAVNAWFASSVGDPAKGPLMMISTILLGEEAMSSGTASPWLGAVIHAVLSVGFGVVFAVIAARLRGNGARALAGTVYGALLYVVNFLIISPLVFPIFGNANQPFEFVAHVAFGTVLSFAFYESTGETRSLTAQTP